MATCQYCGKTENTLFRLAGYVCSECRPSCPSCGKADNGFPISGSATRLDGELVLWCAGCGQLAPLDVLDLQPPVAGADGGLTEAAGLMGLTLREDADTDDDGEPVTVTARDLCEQGDYRLVGPATERSWREGAA